MAVVDIDEAAKRLGASTGKLDTVTQFIEGIAYGGKDSEVSLPNEPSKKVPSIRKMLNDSVDTIHGNIKDVGETEALCMIDFKDTNAAYTVTLTEPSTSISFENTTNLGGRLVQTLLFVKQGTGANKVTTWPSNIKWASGVAPVLSYGKDQEDVIAVTTHDGGVTWYGIFCGGRFK